MVLHQPGDVCFIFHYEYEGFHRLHCIQVRHPAGTAGVLFSREL